MWVRRTLTLLFYLTGSSYGLGPRKKLNINTLLFSDVDDAAALLLASTHPGADLPDVNINYPSTYSALAVYNILGYNGQSHVLGLSSHSPTTLFSTSDHSVPENIQVKSRIIGKSMPHFDGKTYAIHGSPWSVSQPSIESGGSKRDDCQYRTFDNLSQLLLSLGDAYSPLSGRDLLEAKPMTFSGTELGEMVYSGARLTVEGPAHDPVNAAYRWYNGYNATHYPWDPLTVLYAIEDLGDTFEFGTDGVYNYIYLYGRNEWQSCGIASASFQHYLKLAILGEALGAILDEAYLQGARMAAQHDKPWQNKCIYCKVGLVFNKET
ncbi:hypothetical protein ETB97_006141 [Aspergillus alliaceus]|uniref:Inosine/uridine-preferring nucleoside hydrolase domain-containing protein n=1 Tax=Petromyces alliaceus TaxID=209559 RepID=A0A5N7CHD2_PETAA|nr:hypothetical protein BDV23DRAFT_181074 [Aspergillus alliaceus]KAF5864911.1 hypothetical protein ETB97_006141 [Aspergillus burnettii]